jgi:hypothetical protein
MRHSICVPFAACVLSMAFAAPAGAQSDAPQPPPAAFPQRDGSHDFDFLIGSWKAHVRTLKNRLNNSTDPKDWVVYEGTEVAWKLLDSNANFEDFDIYSEELHKRSKGSEALRLYNPATRQWSIYLVDIDAGTIDLPPMVGHFEGKRGEFYNQDLFKGRAKLTRLVWLDISPHEARLEQAFSTDGGMTWEVNWICELTR